MIKQLRMIYFLSRTFKNSVFGRGRSPGFILAALKNAVFFVLLSPAFIFARDIINITSGDIVEIDAKKRILVFRNNVAVTQKSSRSTLNADRLVMTKDSDEGSTILEAEGGVKVFNMSSTSDSFQRDLTVTCDWLYFNQEESFLRLKGRVVAESGEYKLVGEQAEYDSLAGKGRVTSKDDKQVKFMFLRKKTQSGLPPKGALLKRGFKGTADEILINKSVWKIILQGRVLIIDADNKSELKAKRVEIFFNPRRQIKEVIATEDFSMRRSGQFSSAERAVFKYDKQTIFLSGDAYVKEKDKIEIRSSGIKMFMAPGKSVVESLDDSPVKMKIPLDVLSR